MTLRPLRSPKSTIKIPTSPNIPNRLLFVESIERAEEGEGVDGDIAVSGVGLAESVACEGSVGILEGEEDFSVIEIDGERGER